VYIVGALDKINEYLCVVNSKPLPRKALVWTLLRSSFRLFRIGPHINVTCVNWMAIKLKESLYRDSIPKTGKYWETLHEDWSNLSLRNVVPIYRTAWCHKLKDHNMNLLRRDNLESYSSKCVVTNKYTCIFICETKTNLWLIFQFLPPLLILTVHIPPTFLHLFLIVSKYFIEFFCILFPYSYLAIYYLNTLFVSFLSLG
jgi:hypothetical protein